MVAEGDLALPVRVAPGRHRRPAMAGIRPLILPIIRIAAVLGLIMVVMPPRLTNQGTEGRTRAVQPIGIPERIEWNACNRSIY
jgi:hypothetical protein